MGPGLRVIGRLAQGCIGALVALIIGGLHMYFADIPVTPRLVTSLLIGTPIVIGSIVAGALKDRPAMLFCILAMLALASHSTLAGERCGQYAKLMAREAQAYVGPDAPVPLYLAQIRQESSCREGVTAWDNGRGLAQFMDGTTAHVSNLFPELGPPDPYDPRWAVRAMVRYDHWLYTRVKGDSVCDKWAATLKSYNAGLGYVQRAQRKSPTPGVWFNATENINAGQSTINFDYSRRYPRVIIWKHQPLFAAYGVITCPGKEP